MELFKYLASGNYVEFKKSVSKIDDVNIVDASGNYLVMHAVVRNRVKEVKLLIKKGCRLDIIDTEKRGIVYVPVKYGYMEMLKVLLGVDGESGVDVDGGNGVGLKNFIDGTGHAIIHYAILFKNVQVFNMLVEMSTDLNLSDKDGNTALHLSVYGNMYDMCVKCLGGGVNINSRTKIGETALHVACNFRYRNIVTLLLNNSANVNIPDIRTEIPAGVYTIYLSDVSTFRLLLNHGMDLSLQDSMGNSVAHHVLMENNVDMVKMCGDKITPNIMKLFNVNGDLLGHLLFIDNIADMELCKRVVRGSSMTFQNKDGNTILHYICRRRMWKLFAPILVEKRLDIFIRNLGGVRIVDYIGDDEIGEFINLVVKSYLFRLRRDGEGVWEDGIDNLCAREGVRWRDLSETERDVIKSLGVIDTDKGVCEEIIRRKIINEIDSGVGLFSSYPIPLTDDKPVTVSDESCSTVNVCGFVGVSLDILVGLIYLLRKHAPIATSTLTTNFITNNVFSEYLKEKNYSLGTKCEFMNFEVMWVYGKLIVSESFNERMKVCLSNTHTRFIIIPLGIEIKEGSHSNYLIFDKLTYEVERFEPYGARVPIEFNYDDELLDSKLSARFKLVDDKIVHIRPGDYLPRIGFQYFDINEGDTKKIGDPCGFCAIWSIWYVDMRLKYPHYERQKLVRRLLKDIRKNNLSFKNMIRNYSDHITRMRDGVLKGADITINDWINEKYTDEQYDYVIRTLRSMIGPLM